MENLKNSLSIFTHEGIISYLLKGIAFTLVLSVFAVCLGLIIGSVLALIRNYCKADRSSFLRFIVTSCIRWIATIYVEVFRNTPLLLWIFICVVFCPCPSFLQHSMFGLSSVSVKLLFKAMVALVLFTSSVITEIVRGGLNSVAEGQFEAGRSQGFNTVQIMWYIVLPQAYRNIIPTLLSQIITTIKDSSYLANVAVIEFMSRIKTLLSSANRYTGAGTIHVSDVFVLFGFACVIYFLINFSISCVVRRLKRV